MSKDKDTKYIPLEEINKINDAYLTELETVKKRLNFIKDPATIEAFQAVLLSSYNGAIEIKALECKVAHEIKVAEIEERRQILKPWRRSRIWRLLLQPLTNRAQDIIEERAELDADIIHSAAEEAIENDRRLHFPETAETKPKRKRLTEILEKLRRAINAADETDTNEAFEEPANACADVEIEPEPATVSENTAAELAAPLVTEQAPTQTEIEMLENVRRARPPRSCRR